MRKNKYQFFMRSEIYRMKYILMIFLFFACSSSKKVNKPIDYCARFEADQSNLTRNYMSESEREERFKKRKADFKQNWEIIERLMEANQLSKVGKDSCYLMFITVTLIHNVQIYPEDIFNKATIDKMKIEFDKGNLSKNNLQTVFTTYKDLTIEEKRCKEMKEMVDYAILTWRMHEIFDEDRYGKLEDIEYIDCSSKK